MILSSSESSRFEYDKPVSKKAPNCRRFPNKKRIINEDEQSNDVEEIDEIVKKKNWNFWF